MTFLNHISRFLSRLGFVSLLGILSLTQIRAADTDLFITGAGGQSSRPNVLILLDNTANWGPMFAAEMTALKAVLSGLDPGLFNIGLMMYVETGNGNDNKDGSYVRFAIRPIDNKDDGNGVVDNASEGLIKTIADLNEIGDRSNNAVYGLAMNEAYKYFAKGLSYSQAQVKRDYMRVSGDPAYVIPVGTDNYQSKNNAFADSTSFNYQIDAELLSRCKENHIIVISNGKGNDNASATKLATDLLAAAGGDTSELTLSPNGYQSNVADEWARFMSRDPKSSETNKPVIYTHAILVEAAGAPPGQYPADWPVLLKNMSVGYGKGSYYYSDGTESSIKAALESAFKEIQATASVFASSALPINTTVRGTFLNQVYMGVFRPEANAAPRWTGNLKLYKVAATTGTSGQVTSIFLAGQDGNSIEDQTTGFTKTLAQSYWTSASTFWDQNFASRFYSYAEIKGGGGASDLPDGELVEKGGAAQQLRISYPGATDKELSKRKLYTHLPGNTTETLDNFDTSLSASYFDLSGSVNISSMTRSGSTVMVNTSAAHGFATGDLITIGGVTPADYNLTAAITKTSDTSFTFTITEQPVSPATTPPFQASLASTSSTITIVSINRTGNVATVYAPTHGLITGDRVEISGALQPEYNVTAVISRVDADRFTYVVEETPSTSITLNSAQVCPAATGQTACPVSKSTQAITAMVRTAGNLTVTVTAKNHGFSTGNIVLIEGVSPSVYTGQWSITKVDKDTFTYTGTWPLGPKTPADAQVGGISAKKAAPAVTVTSLVRSGSTVTATTSAAHGFVVGNSVAVSGATQTQYNGTFAVIAVTSTSPYTFQYTIVTSPGVPTAWGTASKAEGNIQKDELVKWVRGENRLQDDNPDLSSTALVRGHLHGDVLHSRPVIVNYNRASAPPPTSDPNSLGRDIVVYYGANDGFLHAVKGGRDASDGVEKWAYIASDHMPKLKTLYAATPSILKKPDMYYFDGSISTFTKDSNDDGRLDNSVSGAADVAWLYATMRRGGRGIHSFDVTDPAATPTLLWKKSNDVSGYEELGQTWSEVTPILIPGSSGPREAVVFNLGYDAAANDPAVNTTTGQTDTSGTSSRQSTATMGRGVMIAEAATGTPIWAATAAGSPTTGALPVSGMTCAISADVAAIDINNDGVTDRLYLSDTCANLWRVDTVGSDTSTWTVRQLGKFGGTGVDARKFLFRPDVVKLDTDSSKLAILVGSGDREAPFDTTVANAFYMILDSTGSDCPNCALSIDADKDPQTPPLITPTRPADLCERNALTANPDAVTACFTKCSSFINDEKLICVQDCLVGEVKTADGSATIVNNTCSTPTVGWKYTYITTGEKTVNAPTTVGTTVYFGTNVPQSVVGDQVCGGLGQARNYELDYATGAPAANLSTADGGSLSYYTVKSGGGFPPSPVGIITTTDDGTVVEGVISGTGIKDPPSPALRKRNRIYWYKVIDK